ncbi:MAG: macro domain-containing protein [Deltaproteobacteria bacterium]|nr:macro domain-containing protein [Deltaproteobacteria bacterium]
MIELTDGNLLNSDTEASVNTVNCVGVMGKGLALQFKKAFPENFKGYEAACLHREIRPSACSCSKPVIFSTLATLSTAPPNAIGVTVAITKISWWVRSRWWLKCAVII